MTDTELELTITRRLEQLLAISTEPGATRHDIAETARDLIELIRGPDLPRWVIETARRDVADLADLSKIGDSVTLDDPEGHIITLRRTR